MLLQDLEKRELINPPTFLTNNTHYLCRMGSTAYGVNTGNSDQDMYGVCIPPRDYIFPPNYIDGFDNRDLTFHQWQKHGVEDKSANGGKGCSYDFSIYSIVNYFYLAMQNNPNVLESLFVRREHVIHSTPAWEIVRENRKLFLHKGVVHKLKSYAFSQLAKAKNCIASLQNIRSFENKHGISHTTTYELAKSGAYGISDENEIYDTQGCHNEYLKLWEEGLKKTARFEAQKIAGQDNKFLYHVFRLADQAEFILNNHDLDLQEPSRVEKMKAIRRGDIPYEDIVRQFGEYEERLSRMFETSTLRMYPPEKEIRALLLSTLESHYGSLKEFLKENNAAELAINEIKNSLRKYSL